MITLIEGERMIFLSTLFSFKNFILLPLNVLLDSIRTCWKSDSNTSNNQVRVAKNEKNLIQKEVRRMCCVESNYIQLNEWLKKMFSYLNLFMKLKLNSVFFIIHHIQVRFRIWEYLKMKVISISQLILLLALFAVVLSFDSESEEEFTGIRSIPCKDGFEKIDKKCVEKCQYGFIYNVSLKKCMKQCKDGYKPNRNGRCAKIVWRRTRKDLTYLTRHWRRHWSLNDMIHRIKSIILLC